MMVSTGIYVRVSTEEQAKEGFSIRAQEEKLRAYAAVKDWHVYSVYMDEGISGKNIEGRPAAKQLIADITSGKVNNVLVYKIDRLTRSTKNLIELVDLFNQHHCAFNSLMEAIDTASATGRMFLKIVGIFAEFERENLAERVRMGFERKVKEGYSLCSYGLTSYGYTRENGSKIQEIDESEAAIVRRVFNMYLHDDYSLSKIAKILNAEKIPTKRDRRWTNGSVKLLLTNPNYVGKVRYSMGDATRYFEADGRHEAILDEAVFYQAQDKIGKIKHVTRTKRPGEGVYFSGVAYCALCGSKLTPQWNVVKTATADGETVKRHPNYFCIQKKKGSCNAKGMSHGKLNAAFEEYIDRIADLSETDGIEQPEQAAKPDHSQEIAAITAELSQIGKKTGEVMKLFMTNAIDFTVYQGMVKFSNERRTELDARLTLLTSEEEIRDTLYTQADIVANFKENWQALNNSARLQFIQKFVKKITVNVETENGGRYGNVVVCDVQFNTF